MTTETSPLNRQPTALDYSSPTQFRFLINQLPKVQYFTTACNIPGISLNEATYNTPLKDIPLIVDDLPTNIDGKLYIFLLLKRYFVSSVIKKTTSGFCFSASLIHKSRSSYDLILNLENNFISLKISKRILLPKIDMFKLAIKNIL